MKKILNSYVGRWRILEMEQWDKDFIDLVGEGHITLDKSNAGELHFGAVDCDLDCRVEKVGDQERIEFTFLGQDEGDEVAGRGWAVLEGDRLRGSMAITPGFLPKDRDNLVRSRGIYRIKLGVPGIYDEVTNRKLIGLSS